MTTRAETEVSPREPARGARALFLVGVVLLVIDVVTVLALWLHRRGVESRTRSERTEAVAKGVRLSVTKVEMSAATREITLPADIHGFREATLYAKVSGYVKSIHAERGQRVAAGQLLAVLVSPETEADVLSARSEEILRKRDADRARALAPAGVMSQQDLENATADEKVAEANLERARTMLRYTELRAPFAGTVTARYVDEGALLPAATGATQAAAPLVAMADTDRLRIFFYVGQDIAPFVEPGDPVTIWQDEIRREIPVTVTRNTGALDPRTRTMQVEIDLDNRLYRLLPGTFAHARLKVHVDPAPEVPNEALVLRDSTTQVALVVDSHVHFADVTLGSSNGKSTLVLRGLRAGDTIGLNVPVEVGEGAAVQPVARLR